MGLFCSSGASQIFVSSHLMPSFMVFDGSSYVGEGSDTISKGSNVRVKMIGSRVDGDGVFAVSYTHLTLPTT